MYILASKYYNDFMYINEDTNMPNLPKGNRANDIRDFRSLNLIDGIDPVNGCFASKDFFCLDNLRDMTPVVGDIVNKSWRVDRVWVTKTGYIRGYHLECILCGKEKDFLTVRTIRDRQVRRCECYRFRL